jgi:hypothetical protein
MTTDDHIMDIKYIFYEVELLIETCKFSIITLAPLFSSRSHTAIPPVLIAQEYGYEIGSFVTTILLYQQNNRK